MKTLEVRQLVKSYFTKRALNGIDLELESGKVYGLLGINGSGKSTLMRIIAGLIKPTTGTIKVMGYNIGVESKKVTAFMPTDNFIYPFMKIEMVAKYYSEMYEDFDLDAFYNILSFMELSKDLKVSALSTGMNGRLKIALTLARNCRLCMLDEPLNGIDPISRDKIVNCIIQNMNDKKTILISSHLVHDIEQILDDVIFIKGGNVIKKGNVEDLREEHNISLEDLYKEVYSNA